MIVIEVGLAIAQGRCDAPLLGGVVLEAIDALEDVVIKRSQLIGAIEIGLAVGGIDQQRPAAGLRHLAGLTRAGPSVAVGGDLTAILGAAHLGLTKQANGTITIAKGKRILAKLLHRIQGHRLHGGIGLSGDGVERLIQLSAVGDGEQGPIDRHKIGGDCSLRRMVGCVPTRSTADRGNRRPTGAALIHGGIHGGHAGIDGLGHRDVVGSGSASPRRAPHGQVGLTGGSIARVQGALLQQGRGTAGDGQGQCATRRFDGVNRGLAGRCGGGDHISWRWG